MTRPGNGPPWEYQVKCSDQVRTKIQHLHLLAVQQGRGQQFIAALRHISDRLRREPEQFGEPLFRLPALKAMLFQVIVSPVVVDYVVHQEKLLVFLKGVKLLS